MDLYIEQLDKDKLKILPDFNTLEFGKSYSDRMFMMTYSNEKKWHDAKICSYKNFEFSPATLVLHYAQEIFEGLKAYRREDNNIGLFRPQDNFNRLNNSARRMCMPEVDTNFVLNALLELLRLEQRWVPDSNGASLYIRPTMIGVDPIIGLKPSQTYLLYIILSPVGAYFKTDGAGLKILVEDTYVRAVAGGTGEAKTGCNYASSLIASREAQKKGYTQVLWLDGVHRRYVEEIGTNNVFFVYGNKVVTPKLNGSILPGITRQSVIDILIHWGMDIEEKQLDINQILKDIDNGAITEAFGSGTAVVISPIATFGYKGKDHSLSNQNTGPITDKIFTALTDIQYGRAKDPFGWTIPIS